MPCATFDASDQIVNSFTHRQIQYFTVEGGIVAGGTAETDDFTVRQYVLPCALRGVNDLRRLHVDHVQVDFGIGHLRFATSQDASQLLIAHFSTAKLDYIASDHKVGPFQCLCFTFNAGLGFQLFHVGAIQHIETAYLLQWVIRMVLD